MESFFGTGGCIRNLVNDCRKNWLKEGVRKERMEISYKLDNFEGPLDLLLHLIEKNKVNIYDIPIVLITEQYLEYVNQMDHEDLDVVSDFLVMAATLLDIKSRMLLPKVEKEEEEDEEDPRAELVRRLLEYKMYKYMAQELEEREQEAELLFFKEPTIPREVAKYEEPLDLDKLLDGLTLAKLQKVFDAVMKRNANKLDPVRSRFSTIRREPISLEQKVKSVLSYAREHRHFKFSDVLERESDRLEIVVAFLAVLELMKMGRIHLVQEKLFDEMQLDTVDVDETEDEAGLELSVLDEEDGKVSEEELKKKLETDGWKILRHKRQTEGGI